MKCPTLSFRSSLPVTILVALLGLTSVTPAQTKTATFDLNDVWMLPNLSHPREKARQMTGTFVWTYTPGKFAEGTGQFTKLNIPWWGTRTTPKLKIVFEAKTIEFTMIGNYHDLGLDIGIKLKTALSPDTPSAFDLTRSKFQVEVGVSRKGTFTKGSVVPRCPKPENYGIGTAGSGKNVPTIASSGGDPRIGSTTFQLDCDKLLGGADCFLVLGTKKATIPFLGATVLVDPVGWILVPVKASGTKGTAGVGTLRIPLKIPNDTRLVAQSAIAQVVAFDSGATQGLSASNGLGAVICR